MTHPTSPSNQYLQLSHYPVQYRVSLWSAPANAKHLQSSLLGLLRWSWFLLFEIYACMSFHVQREVSIFELVLVWSLDHVQAHDAFVEGAFYL